MIRIISIVLISFASLVPYLVIFNRWLDVGNDLAGWISMVLGWVVTPILLLHFWKAKQSPEIISERVVFNDFEVTRYRGGEVIEKIDWESVTEISVHTTNEGPWGEDAFIVLCNPETEKGCLIPNGARGVHDLVSRLCKIPGFDEKNFIQAMGCTSNNKFLCWRKSEST